MRDAITDEKYYTWLDIIKISGILLVIGLCCLYVFGKLFGAI